MTIDEIQEEFENEIFAVVEDYRFALASQFGMEDDEIEKYIDRWLKRTD